MKPRRAKGWSCSCCKNIYQDSEWGKERAKVCCACRECGGYGEYVGTDSYCNDCFLKRNLSYAEENFNHAQVRLENAKKDMESHQQLIKSRKSKNK